MFRMDLQKNRFRNLANASRAGKCGFFVRARLRLSVCISPNDVPGYDKDQYMPDAMKDENGKAYAYRDAAGNYYELNFVLHYE